MPERAGDAALAASPGRPSSGRPSGASAGTGLRRAVVAGVLGKAAEALTLVLLATLVPRLLGPADYGRLSVALTLVAVGSVAMTLGGATLLARYVPAAPAPGRPALARALTLRLARNRVLPFTALGLGGAALAVLTPERFPPLAVASVLVALLLNVVATLALQADLGLGRAAAWSARYPVQNAVLVGAVLVLHTAAGADGAVVAVAVAATAGVALAAAATAPLWTSLRHDAPVALPPGAARFGVLQAGSGALTQVVQRGGVVAVAVAGTARETGFAAAAVGVTLAATYAVAQIFTVTLPALTARHTAGDDARPAEPATPGPTAAEPATPGPTAAEPTVSGPAAPEPGTVRGSAIAAPPARGPAAAEPAARRLAGAMLAAILVAMAVAVPAADVAVPVVLGAAYGDATAAFHAALATVVLAPLNALALQAAALRLRPEVTLAAAAAGAVVFAGTALVAVPAWGAAGATTAALAGTAASAAVAVALLPGAVGWRLVLATAAGAAAVAGWGFLA